MRRERRFREVFETLGQPARGSFLRAIRLKYRNEPLSAAGSIKTGGRYNPKGAFEVLYMAHQGDTVLREIRLVQDDASGAIVTIPTPPYILMTVHYEVSFAVDLCDSDVQTRLGITPDFLVQHWEIDDLKGKVPITHDLGRAARAAGIEALIVPSARHPGYQNIAIIKDQLLTTSFVRIHQPDGFDPGVETETRGTKATIAAYGHANAAKIAADTHRVMEHLKKHPEWNDDPADFFQG